MILGEFILNWKTWTTGIGLAVSIVGFAGYNAKDVIVARYFPELQSTTKGDLDPIARDLETANLTVAETRKSAEESQRAAEEGRKAAEESKRAAEKNAEMLQKLLMLQGQQAEKNDLPLGLAQETEYEYSVKSVLESTDPGTANARNALANQETAIAAASLIELAEKQEKDAETSPGAAADTWRKAAALLYTIDPAKSATAYKKAADLAADPRRFNSLAAEAMENERRRRASADAPGTNLLVDEYIGPVRDFSQPFEAGNLKVQPETCTNTGNGLRCRIKISKSGPEAKVEIEGIKLIDDWARQYSPSSIQIANREDRGSSIYPRLGPGDHALTLTFANVPGGTNYGLEFYINDSYAPRWRNVPAQVLSTTLREQWGGPLGLASFVPINEQRSMDPYGVKLTACERLGQRLACFGELGYEGPIHKAEIRNLRLVDGKNREYFPYHVRFGSRFDNGSSIYPNLETGLVTFEIYFWASPVFESYKLKGQISDTPFEFNPFKTNQNDPDAEDRLNYFWSWPPRVEVGNSIRQDDFLFEPKSCEREEYAATCLIGVTYVGPEKKVPITGVALIDHKGNRYQPSLLEINGRRDNGSSIYPYLHAGRFILSAKFDSLPKSRLYELEARVDNLVQLAVVNLALPAEDGAMGLPSDIKYTPIQAVGQSGPLDITVHGCTRRSETAACYLQVDYAGPKEKVAITNVQMSISGGAALAASNIEIANQSVRRSFVDPTLSTGTYPMLIEFSGLPENSDVTFSMTVNKAAPFRWTGKLD